MALKILDHGSKEYHQMVELRTQILRKPLGLTFSPQELENEKNDLLIGAFEDEEMLGCCMLVKENPQIIRLRQMAVQNNLQGKGIGASLMHFAEDLCRDLGARKIIMHARATAVGFYEKLGYKVVSDVFEEVSIPHYIMEKDIV
ncbi:MAG TPA: GNAT family N-acetyltransferase [Parasegetibacter sp.]|jgi:predicted GNAT family N-acyltransferase